MEIKFTVPGEPKSKLRHRTTKGGFSYNPKQNIEYENWVKQCYYMEYKDTKLLDGQIEATVKAYFTIPKSVSKKRRKMMIDEEIRPTKRPDTDNLAKIILDSLNSITYLDDKQVVDLQVQKYYSENPRVEVILKTISEAM